MLLLASGCSAPGVTVSATPIPLQLNGGALTAFASIDGYSFPVPVVIDTGTPLTAYDTSPGETYAATERLGNFRLYPSLADPTAARLEYDSVPLFFTPLRSLGLAPGYAVQAVLGGDNLQRSAVSLDYRGATPQMTLTPVVTQCACQLATDCQAVFPFSLEGGQNAISLDGNVYGYPATRVVLGACIEPLVDPVSSTDPSYVDCALGKNLGDPLNAPYVPSGTEMRLLVATGFPGLALSQSAFRRLPPHTTGASARLHLPDPDDDGPLNPNGTSDGLAVDVGLLGDSTHSALALVSDERYFGPCGELARSRRLRRSYSVPASQQPNESACQLTNDQPRPPNPDQNALVRQCSAFTNSDCSDNGTYTAAALLELKSQIQIYVLPDTAPIFQSIAGDVQPSNPVVDGIIGTTVLSQLVATVDYPSNRFIARCAGGQANCLTYPRFTGDTSCGLPCDSLDKISDHAGDRPGGLCSPAP